MPLILNDSTSNGQSLTNYPYHVYSHSFIADSGRPAIITAAATPQREIILTTGQLLIFPVLMLPRLFQPGVILRQARRLVGPTINNGVNENLTASTNGALIVVPYNLVLGAMVH